MKIIEKSAMRAPVKFQIEVCGTETSHYNNTQIFLLFFMILLLLLSSEVFAGTNLQTYWPLNDGDRKIFKYGAETLTLSVTGSFDQYRVNAETTTGSSGYEMHQFSSDRVQVVSGKTGWITISFSPAIDLLSESALANGGTITTRTTVTQRYAGSYPATFTVTVGMAGTVTVPAGTFHNCRSVSIGEVATIPDQGTVSVNYLTAILAPNVGIIKRIVDPDSGAWAELVSGNVGGVDVTKIPFTPAITTVSPLPQGMVGIAYNQSLEASGGTTPYAWSISSGSLPAGLSLSSSGVISGTPASTATASFTVRITGSNGLSNTKAFSLTILAAGGGGFDVTSSLWAKAVLQVSGSPVALKWKEVGADITPSGDQVISGYFYADPDDFAYGSEFNPEVFVKIYIAKNGWCNIAFNHVTVDNVTVSSAHHFAGTAQQAGTAMLSNRLVEHSYIGVAIQNSSPKEGTLAPTSTDSGYIMTSGLWSKAVLQPAIGPVTLIWKEVGSDITPSGDKVVSGYFYADPGDFAYGSEFNPEVFVKIYIAKSGWCNIAFNHVTVDPVSLSSAYHYAGLANKSGTASLSGRLIEHQYNGVKIDDVAEVTVPGSPTIGTVTGGNGLSTVSFTAPISDGGSAITGYIVTSTPGGKTGTGTASPITVTGLTNGTVYTFTVQAINAVGTGPGSVASDEVTPDWGVPVAGRIPDTGQITSYTDTFGEDSDYILNPPSYTKLDSTGKDLPDSAPDWAMVKDNVTGLIWENKTDDGGIHDKDNQYTWYNSDSATNGGNAGTVGDGTDTQDFIDALNAAKFGGFNDWRLPTIKELFTLAYRNQHIPEIKTDFFSNTQTTYYWSSSTHARFSDDAWSVDFFYGYGDHHGKSDSYCVRAVRGEPHELFGDSVIPGRTVNSGEVPHSSKLSDLYVRAVRGGQ